nr:alpha-amylase family glycosyl hydrolase [Jannaschia seohaensis]
MGGITAKLAYLAELDIDGVWISPIYPSPMVDFGHDISDHTGIDPIFGTLDDFERLVEAAHSKGLKIILDFVPCHTSDQHPCLLDSRRGHDAEKRGWHIWRDAAEDGGPPNNWLSEFGGPAWTFDPASGQHYSHAHLREQPELNRRNAQVRAAMTEIMRLWFDRGVDGLRIDAVDQIGKDALFRDNPPNPDWHAGRPSSERYL